MLVKEYDESIEKHIFYMYCPQCKKRKRIQSDNIKITIKSDEFFIRSTCECGLTDYYKMDDNNYRLFTDSIMKGYK